MAFKLNNNSKISLLLLSLLFLLIVSVIGIKKSVLFTNINRSYSTEKRKYFPCKTKTIRKEKYSKSILFIFTHSFDTAEK